MKLLAINGSPRMDKGSTALVLNAFLDGVKEAGGEVKLLYTSKLDIKPCQGEFSCWTKSPGKCFQKDDMSTVLEHLKWADVLVLGAPLYVDSFPGPVKNLLDRMIPALEPFFEIRDGRTRHPVRKGYGGKKIVLVSVCGLYKLENFDSLVGHTKALCKNYDAEFAGAVLRPHGGGLVFMKGRDEIDRLEKACFEAGVELVEKGSIPQQYQEAVSFPLATQQEHLDITNKAFKGALDRS